MEKLKANKWSGAILLIAMVTVFGPELTAFGAEYSQTIRTVRPLEAEEEEAFTEPPGEYEDENGAVYDLEDWKLDRLPGGQVSQEASRQVVYRAVEGAQSVPSTITVHEQRSNVSHGREFQVNGARDRGALDSSFQVSGSRDSSSQDSSARDRGSQVIGARDSSAQVNVPQDSISQDRDSQVNGARDSSFQVSGSRDSSSQDSSARDRGSQVNGARNSSAQVNVPQDSISRDSISQGSISQDSISQDSISQEVSGSLSATETRILGETWSDDFRVPMVFHSYGAQVYELGNVSISAEDGFPPPEEYQDELLGILKLPRDDYEITQLAWNGEPYAGSDGELCREAVASGRKRLVDYQVTYEGRVSWQLPDTCRLETVYRLRPSVVETEGSVLPETSAAEIPSPESDKPKLWYWVRSGFVITVAAGLAGIAVGILILLVMWLKREQNAKQHLSKIKG